MLHGLITVVTCPLSVTNKVDETLAEGIHMLTTLLIHDGGRVLRIDTRAAWGMLMPSLQLTPVKTAMLVGWLIRICCEFRVACLLKKWILIN